MAFGEAGEALARFGKGDLVQVQGRLQSSTYTDRDGLKRTTVEVVVLRSDPAPLARKLQNNPAPEPPVEDAAEETVAIYFIAK